MTKNNQQDICHLLSRLLISKDDKKIYVYFIFLLLFIIKGYHRISGSNNINNLMKILIIIDIISSKV